jgi:hypothetical protein
MPGTILIVILVLALLGALPRDRKAGIGGIIRAEELDCSF